MRPEESDEAMTKNGDFAMNARQRSSSELVTLASTFGFGFPRTSSMSVSLESTSRNTKESTVGVIWQLLLEIACPRLT